jgi:hypothetical protein
MAEGDMPETPKAAGGGDLTSTAMSVLTYIDSPFKLIVVILLGVLGYTGYFIHSNFDLFFNVWEKQRQLPQMNEDRFDQVAADTMRELKAEVLVIFEVDPILNKRVSVRAYQKDGGRAEDVEGIDVGLFTSNLSNNQDAIELIAGNIPCGQYRRPQSEIGLWYLTKGVTFTCRVSVPPEINQFIGQITVGWKEQPVDLGYARDILHVAARAVSRSE